MIARFARFKVWPETLAECNAAVDAFAKATAAEPGVLTYDAYRHEDGLSFTHVMVFRDDAAEVAHRGATHVQVFTSILQGRCQEDPSFERVTLTASAKG